MFRRRRSVRGLDLVATALALVATIGCTPADPSSLPLACSEGEAVVPLETVDGVELYADYQPAPDEGGGAIVLLHQRPPTFHRGDWPSSFRDALAAEGFSVLNVDRRGAGFSGGDADDAWHELGRYDAEAAVQFLVDDARACRADPARLVLIGASNGTTTALDYALAHDDVLPDVARMVWLSPGDYTETQHAIADHRSTLDPMPILWIRPTTEDWSTSFEPSAPVAWDFLTVGDAHGTALFADEATTTTVTSAIRAHVAW